MLTLLLVLAAFSLAACGDDEETTTTAGATTSSEAETTTSMATETTAGGLAAPIVIQLTGQEEVPPVTTDATGTFTLEFVVGGSGTDTTAAGTGTTTGGDTTSSEPGDGTTTTASGAGGALGGMALQWTLEVEGMMDVTAAHIHLGARGQNGNVLVPLFTGPTKEGEFSGVLAEGTLTLADLPAVEGMTPDQILAVIQSGGTYVNVHTTQNPNGEIRGQIELMSAGGASTGTTSGGTDTTAGGDDTTTSY
jgi:hypothetical protein